MGNDTRGWGGPGEIGAVIFIGVGGDDRYEIVGGGEGRKGWCDVEGGCRGSSGVCSAGDGGGRDEGNAGDNEYRDAGGYICDAGGGDARTNVGHHLAELVLVFR